MASISLTKETEGRNKEGLFTNWGGTRRFLCVTHVDPNGHKIKITVMLMLIMQLE